MGFGVLLCWPIHVLALKLDNPLLAERHWSAAVGCARAACICHVTAASTQNLHPQPPSQTHTHQLNLYRTARSSLNNLPPPLPLLLSCRGRVALHPCNITHSIELPPMARPKRNNSSGDPTVRPKITPISPRRKQARSLPPTSSVHDEASMTDRPSADFAEASAPSQTGNLGLTSPGVQSSAGSTDRDIDARTTPLSSLPPQMSSDVQAKMPADGKKRLAPQRRGVVATSRKFMDGDERHGAEDGGYFVGFIHVTLCARAASP